MQFVGTDFFGVNANAVHLDELQRQFADWKISDCSGYFRLEVSKIYLGCSFYRLPATVPKIRLVKCTVAGNPQLHCSVVE